MPNTLRFYQDFTPNLGRGEHYYFDDIDDYLTAISSHLFGYIETLDNYRISSLVLRFPYPIQYDEQTGDFAHFENITYIAEYDERIQLWRFYHVKSFTYLSNYIEFNLSRDLWADFIAKASLEHIFVQRCNRLPIGVGCAEFDAVANTKTKADSTLSYKNFLALDDAPTNLDKIWIVFVCVYEVYKRTGLFIDKIATSDIQVYAVQPSTYIHDSNVKNYEKIQKTINAIAAIYGVDTGGGNFNDAYASCCYIVHEDYIPRRATAINTFLSANHDAFQYDGNSTHSYEKNLYAVNPSYMNIKYDILPSIGETQYFGTPTAMLCLPKTIDSDGYIRPTIECIVKKDDIQIIARCGDNQLDLSKSFSVGLPNATGPASPEEQIARGVSTVGALVGAGANMAAGNYVGGALGIATALLPRDKATNAQYKSNGDGYTSWLGWNAPINDNDYNLRYPIGITVYPSIDDDIEKNNVKNNGAIINAFVSTIDDCMQGTALISGLTTNEAYVKATIDVENVPLDAGNYIAAEFANGLEIIEL